MKMKRAPLTRGGSRMFPLMMLLALLLWVPVSDQVDGGVISQPDEIPFTDGQLQEPDRAERDKGQSKANKVTENLPAPDWPDQTTTSLDVSASKYTKAKGTPVSLRSDDSSGSEAVSVTVHKQSKSKAAGISGVRLDLVRKGGGKSESDISVRVDYEAFAHAFGGDWASRLKLWRLADGDASPLESFNDLEKDRVTATVQVTEKTARLVLMADGAGKAGNYSASKLASSASWSAGGNSGDFAWTYPLVTPNPVGAGLRPDLSLSYNSSSVDGRNEATNNQPGVVGEGWNLGGAGSIQRRYGDCSDDMGGDANNGEKTQDKCWVTGGTVMLDLAGHAGEVIRDSKTDEWHLRNDDGTRIEKLTDTSNADDSNEYWRVTTPDGAQYYFGLNRLPGWSSGKPETDSVNAVPVAGNNPDEPCHSTTFKDSFCDQAWRWNLDYVVSPSGNSMSFWYSAQTNRYAKNSDPDHPAEYVRDSQLTRIDYGTHNRGGTDTVYAGEAPGRVSLTYTDRCLSSCDKHDESHWPDTPWDKSCTSGSCNEVYSPVFFSTKMLASVKTQVWNSAAKGYANLDSWSLKQTFPNPGDGTRAGAWLDSITHSGLNGGTKELPKVTFDWLQKQNRVEDYSGVPTMNWMRIGDIRTESGAHIGVTYSEQDCGDKNVPTPSANTRRCYPVKVPDPFDDDKLLTHWYHKYLVTLVSEADNLTKTVKKTRYEYVGDAAWRYAEPDAFEEDKYRTWSQWRGYSKVRTRVGDTHPSLAETTFFRGMDGDRNGSGGKREVDVAAGVGDAIADDDAFSGMPRQTSTYNGDASKPVSRTVFEPWKSKATASRTWKGDTTRAYFTNSDHVTYQQRALDADRGWQTTKTTNTYDEYGMTVTTGETGDTEVSGDEQCTLIDYNRNTKRNLLGLTQRTRVHAVACGVEPATVDEIVSDTRTSYDGKDYGATPAVGLVTKTETVNGFSNGTPSYATESKAEHDAYGRVTASWDIRGNKTSTSYTPTTGRYSSVTTTQPLGWKTVTNVDARGNTLAETDADGLTTTFTYDPLGRVTKVWLPNQPTTRDANYSYSYSVSDTGLNTVTTKELNAATTTTVSRYSTSVTIMDGLLRQVQAQSLSPGEDGGRVVIDTTYDDHGRVSKTEGPYRADGEPDASGRFIPDADILVRRSETKYDAADRQIAQITYDLHDELWRTTTVYGGDHQTVIPPEGGVPTTTVSDADGQTIELRQHLTPDASGEYQSTRYEYDGKDQLAKVVDPEGNSWTWKHDVRGNKIASDDPDKGDTTNVYNDAGDLLSTTDARGESLSYSYDEIGRRTGLYQGANPTGARLAEWRYDTSTRGTGLLGGWSRFVGDDEYRYDVLSYSTLHLPMATQYTIPETEKGLAGKYQYSHGYAIDGQVKSLRYPQAGDATVETVNTTFDQRSGLPLTLSGPDKGDGYVTQTAYTGFGELQSMRYGQGTGSQQTDYAQQTRYYDDATRRLDRTNVYHEKSDGLVSDTHYDYDPSGNPTAINDGVTGDNQCFGYDDLNRLAEAWTPADADCSSAPSAATLGGPAPYWTSYEFDAVGNRTSMRQHGGDGDTDDVTEYTTPEPGEARPHAITGTTVTSEETEQPVAETADIAESSYRYDEAGNMISRPGSNGAEQALSWTAEGQVDEITDTATGDKQSHVYTADGERLIRRSLNGERTLFLPGQEITAAKDGSTSKADRYYSFAGTVFAVRKANRVSWLFNDHHNTASMSIGSDGKVVHRYLDPYGSTRGSSPTSWPGSRGFVGGTIDQSGLTRLGARDYDPELGVFTSVDPILDTSMPAQMNAYSYSGGNPVTYSDPSGEKFCGNESCTDWALPDGNGGYWAGSKNGNKRSTWHYSSKGVKDYVKDEDLTPPPRPKPKPKSCAWYDVGCHASTAWDWAKDNADVVGFATGLVVGVACTALTGGAGAIACGALAGAIGSGLSSALKGDSPLEIVAEAAQGAAWGALGGAAGAVLGGVLKGGSSAVVRGVKGTLPKLGKVGGGFKDGLRDISKSFRPSGWKEMRANAALMKPRSVAKAIRETLNPEKSHSMNAKDWAELNASAAGNAAGNTAVHVISGYAHGQNPWPNSGSVAFAGYFGGLLS